MQVGIVGLGAMGSAIAANVLKAGFPLIAYNRTRAKAEALAAQGARVAATPAEAASGDVVITMLANDAAVEASVLGADGVLAGLKPAAIHISMSTISVALAKRLAEAHAAKDQGFISAPVFGRPEAAAAAKLFVVVAGPTRDTARALPLLETLGQRVFVIGEAAPRANLVKLAGNFLITSVIETLSEAFALARKGGVDPAQFLDIVLGTLFDAPVYRTYGTLIAEERFQPAGFAARLGHKDVSLVREAAKDLDVNMPLADLIEARLATLIAQGGGDLDWSALAKLASEEAGLEPPPPSGQSGRG